LEAGVTLRDTERGGTLRVTLDLPGFFVGPDDTDEDIECAMALDGDECVVTFIGFEGDNPQRQLRTLTGTLRKVEVVR
jgi:hypothetical protein